ncbi:MAG: short-chain fatty acyl-CoA regulator family protein [Alphaproteobacteria bacterium]|nr:short-chain fatty acyl-CoA regulator family protein [Alphaproteobacteria bacterium]
MATKVLMGGKVRRMRREQGLTQVDMARRLGISPSYLNLIEHNQRQLTLSLLLNIGKTFAVDLEVFSEDEESRLAADLTELFGDPLFRDIDISQPELLDMVAASPGLCQQVLTLYRSFRNAREDVRSLTERLSGDPFLSTSTHELRTILTSIRSFSEILRDHGDIDEAKRQEFLGLLVGESKKLGSTINEMLDYAAAAGREGQEGNALPGEEVRDFFQSAGNYFAGLELAAETFRESLAAAGGGRGAAIIAELSRRHGIDLRIEPVAGGAPGYRFYDPEQKRLFLSEALPPASRDFQAVRQIALAAAEDMLDPVLAANPPSGSAAWDQARGALAGYFAAAVMMPYQPFLEAAQTLRYDIEILGRRFDAGFEQVCHRLASLRRPGAGGVPFHFVRVDIAGNVIKQFSASGLHIARFGGACPRWNVHAAFLTPERIDRQIARMPDGGTYFNIARALRRAPSRPGDPPIWSAVGLGCEISYASELVYGDGLDLGADDNVVPVGVTCRLCERSDCAQRVAPAIFVEAPVRSVEK